MAEESKKSTKITKGSNKTLKKTTITKKTIDPKTGKVLAIKKDSKKKEPLDSKTKKVSQKKNSVKEVAKPKKKIVTSKTVTKEVSKQPKQDEKKVLITPVTDDSNKISNIENVSQTEVSNSSTKQEDKLLVESEKGQSKTAKKTPSTQKQVKKKTSKELTIEPPKREPVVIVRPTPKKTKELSKDEKLELKSLKEAFSYIANLTLVIEERTMDKKVIPDLAIGELHVIETVSKNNNKPMTLIAKKEKVTVGALTICINRLVQKGYLLRTRDEMDHRVILLSVTPLAKKVLKAHDKFHDDIVGIALESINLAQATKVMNAFMHTLEIYYDPSLIEEEKKNSKKSVKKNKAA